MSPARLLIAFAVALVVASGPAPATAPMPESPVDLDTQTILNSDGFLRYHPDMRHRNEGAKAFQDGFFGDALTHFTQAARYADKASQAMIAEMHFTGTGVPRDRALGYAWMDLAAERAYPAFLALREAYWAALTPEEQARAVDVGQDIYAEFEDAVARPRMERQLVRGKRSMTGSRVGARGNMEIQMAGPGGLPITITGEQFYDDRYWEPREYWAWQDEVWSAPLRGRVDVLPIRQVDDGED